MRETQQQDALWSDAKRHRHKLLKRWGVQRWKARRVRAETLERERLREATRVYARAAFIMAWKMWKDAVHRRQVMLDAAQFFAGHNVVTAFSHWKLHIQDLRSLFALGAAGVAEAAAPLAPAPVEVGSPRQIEAERDNRTVSHSPYKDRTKKSPPRPKSPKSPARATPPRALTVAPFAVKPVAKMTALQERMLAELFDRAVNDPLMNDAEIFWVAHHTVTAFHTWSRWSKGLKQLFSQGAAGLPVAKMAAGHAPTEAFLERATGTQGNVTPVSSGALTPASSAAPKRTPPSRPKMSFHVRRW
eukprot:5298384-Prymnesium_polylepis.1